MDEPQIELVGVNRTFEVRRWEGLRRRTRSITALDDVSLAVNAGEMVGCLGIAGAGKSTAIGIISGTLAADTGHVRTGGLPPVRSRAELAGRIGVVLGGRPQLPPDLSLAESLPLLAAIHRLIPGRWQLRQDQLVEHLDLGGHLVTPVGRLPPGAQLRAELAAALLHEPSLLLLDEPGAGLDVGSRERVRGCLRHENRVYGRTVLLASRELGDVQRLCDRVLVLDRGRLAYDGTLPGLTDRGGGRRVLVIDLTEPAKPLDGVSGTEVVQVEAGGRRQRLAFTSGSTGVAQVLAEIAARADVRDVTLIEPDVADLVRRLND